MAFSYTNVTKSAEYEPLVALGLKDNYALKADEPEMVRLTNSTASMEQPEEITYRCIPIKNVSTGIKVRNKGVDPSGVQYVIKVETVDRITVGDATIDEPISMWLTIKHPASNNWDNAKVAGILSRLVSACMKGQTTGSAKEATASNWRFEDLMRSALAPTTN